MISSHFVTFSKKLKAILLAPILTFLAKHTGYWPQILYSGPVVVHSEIIQASTLEADRIASLLDRY